MNSTLASAKKARRQVARAVLYPATIVFSEAILLPAASRHNIYKLSGGEGGEKLIARDAMNQLETEASSFWLGLHTGLCFQHLLEHPQRVAAGYLRHVTFR
jgi:hypothetical protein